MCALNKRSLKHISLNKNTINIYAAPKYCLAVVSICNSTLLSEQGVRMLRNTTNDTRQMLVCYDGE